MAESSNSWWISGNQGVMSVRGAGQVLGTNPNNYLVEHHKTRSL